MMEFNGLHHIAGEFKDVFGDKEFMITHDGDNKSNNLYKDEGLNVSHYRDSGHAIKSLRNAFTSVRRQLNYVRSNEQPFYGIIEKMLSFARFLIYNIDSGEMLRTILQVIIDFVFILKISKDEGDLKKKKDKKVFQIWQRGVENDNYQNALKIYCDKTSIIRACSSRMNTNRNESLHASMAAFTSKRIDYRKSYSARIDFAIGRNNDRQFVKKVLDKVFKKGELPYVVYDSILKLEIEKNNIIEIFQLNELNELIQIFYLKIKLYGKNDSINKMIIDRKKTNFLI